MTTNASSYPMKEIKPTYGILYEKVWVPPVSVFLKQSGWPVIHLHWPSAPWSPMRLVLLQHLHLGPDSKNGFREVWGQKGFKGVAKNIKIAS